MAHGKMLRDFFFGSIDAYFDAFAYSKIDWSLWRSWIFFVFPFSWEFHHPNGRTHIFQRGWNHQPVYVSGLNEFLGCSPWNSRCVCLVEGLFTILWWKITVKFQTTLTVEFPAISLCDPIVTGRPSIYSRVSQKTPTILPWNRSFSHSPIILPNLSHGFARHLT